MLAPWVRLLPCTRATGPRPRPVRSFNHFSALRRARAVSPGSAPRCRVRFGTAASSTTPRRLTFGRKWLDRRSTGRRTLRGPKRAPLTRGVTCREFSNDSSSSRGVRRVSAPSNRCAVPRLTHAAGRRPRGSSASSAPAGRECDPHPTRDRPSRRHGTTPPPRTAGDRDARRAARARAAPAWRHRHPADEARRPRAHRQGAAGRRCQPLSFSGSMTSSAGGAVTVTGSSKAEKSNEPGSLPPSTVILSA